MTRAGEAETTANEGRRITVRAVVAAALGTYRRRFWRVALAATVIVLPLDLIVSLLQEMAKLPQDGSAFAWTTRFGAAVRAQRRHHHRSHGDAAALVGRGLGLFCS